MIFCACRESSKKTGKPKAKSTKTPKPKAALPAKKLVKSYGVPSKSGKKLKHDKNAPVPLLCTLYREQFTYEPAKRE